MFDKPEANFKAYAIIENDLLPNGHVVCASLKHGSRVFVTTGYRCHIFTVDNKVDNFDTYREKPDIIGMRTYEMYGFLDLLQPLDLVYAIPIDVDFELNRLRNL